jgi:methylenetetrahydrofolate reductase (NADPH)
MTTPTNSSTSSPESRRKLALRPGAGRDALATALRNASYEVLPFKTAEEKILAHVPTSVPMTVTTTEAKGFGPTVSLAIKLSKQGYKAAPHLAARNVRDDAHLTDLVAELREAGIDSVFVIGGDANDPAGSFPDALSLLEGLDRIGHPFTTVGIGGHPEGHGKISDSIMEQALVAKAPHATQILTQLCFDAGTIINWAKGVQASGVRLPIRVSIPGAINRQKLIRVSAGLGIGQSAKIISKQQGMLWRFFLPGGYSPNKLVEKLTPAFAQDDNQLSGFHVATFNELEATEAWRQRWLERLA